MWRETAIERAAGFTTRLFDNPTRRNCHWAIIPVNMDIESPLLNDRQVGALLGIAVTTVRRWRLDNIGPRFVKFSFSRRGLVRYRMCHIVQWLG